MPKVCCWLICECNIIFAGCFNKQLLNLSGLTHGKHGGYISAHTFIHTNLKLLHSFSGSLEGGLSFPKGKELWLLAGECLNIYALWV